MNVTFARFEYIANRKYQTTKKINITREFINSNYTTGF